MEATIASLEEQLAVANDDKEQAILRSESLVSEVLALTDKMNMSNSDLATLQGTVSSLVCFP